MIACLTSAVVAIVLAPPPAKPVNPAPPATPVQPGGPTSLVEFTVIRPDGKPAADVEVVVEPIGHLSPLEARNPPRAKTDAKGRAQIAVLTRAVRLRLVLAGVGCADSDLIARPAEGAAVVGLPRLVPFGTIRGTLPEAVRGDDVTLDPQGNLTGKRNVEPIPVGADGRFEFTDLRASRYILQPRRGGEPVGVVANVTLSPGETETVEPDAFHDDPQLPKPAPPKPAAKPDEPAKPAPYAARNQPPPDAWPFPAMVWLGGTVRRADGNPSGAQVFLQGSQPWPVDPDVVTHQTAAAAHGRWEIRSIDASRRIGSGLIVAHERERPPAIVAFRGGISAWDGSVEPVTEPARYDLVIPEREDGGLLSVRVLDEAGKPAVGATVACTAGGRDALFRLGHRRSPEADALDKILRPEETTDETGRADFQYLLPGTYVLDVTERRPEGSSNFEWDYYRAQRIVCQGIAVERGKVTNYVVQLSPQRHDVAFELHDVDGRAVAGRDLSLELIMPNENAGGTQGLKLDAAGRGTISIYQPGLRTARIRYQDGRITSYPVREGPFSEATAVVAGSPLLADMPPLVLSASDRDAASVEVALRDADGKPARGHVKAFGGWPESTLFGGTDDDGALAWSSFPLGRRRFYAFLPGVEAPACGERHPFADDEQLVDRKLPLAKGAEVAVGRRVRVTFEPQPVGYVRGRVQPAPGRTAADYRLNDPTGWDASPQYRTYYDRETGDFLLGPLAVGPSRVELVEVQPSTARVSCLVRAFTVESDRVTELELAAEPTKTVEPVDFVTAQRAAAMPRIGRVFAPDGVSPAPRAAIAFYRPDAPHAYPSVQADTDGRFTYRRDLLRLGLDDQALTDYRVAAWLPGNFAPTTVPLPAENDGTELRIVLAAGGRAKGNVTIGGEPADGVGNRLQVRVTAADGDVVRDQPWREPLIPSADGTFALVGLAVGKYRAQAAFDGIWLSPTVEFTIGDRAGDTVTLALDVGAPGPPSVVTCVDRRGKPAAGVDFTLRRPEGPLVETLWPRTLTSDAAGLLHVPPLEAGTHLLEAAGNATPFELKIAPLEKGGAEPHRQTIRID